MIDAIVGHLVGDYILQNDWMAQGKKKSSLICSIHCITWSASVCLFSGCFSLVLFVLLFVSHFIQDRTNIIRWWMGRIGQDGFAENLGPWSVIVVDNVFHIVVIWVLYHGGVFGL